MSIRAVVIDGYKSDEEGRRKAKTFMRVVSQSLRCVSHVAEFHLVMLGIEELQDFIYDSSSNERTRNQALRNFSSIDMSFIGGDGDLSPWHPRASLLLAYMNQCVVGGSFVLGDEVATRMLWHLSCVNGRQLHVVDVLNEEGKEEEDALPSLQVPRAFTGSSSVMLDETTGEAFQFVEQEHKDRTMSWRGKIHQTTLGRCCNVGVRRRHETNLPFTQDGKREKDSASLRLTKARGVESHWLMPQIPSTQETTAKSLLECFKHRHPRTFDINTKQDPSSAGVDPMAPFQGMSINGFSGPEGHMGRRGRSAKCRQPDRSITILASSQFGPEILECRNILCINFGFFKEEAALPLLIMRAYITHNVKEHHESDESALGEHHRRDMSFKQLLESSPLLDRFNFQHLEHAWATYGHNHYGAGCADILRQLFREGVLPAPQHTPNHAFVTFKKVAAVKFVREELGATSTSRTTSQATKNNRPQSESPSRMTAAITRLPSIATNKAYLDSERVIKINVPKQPPTNFYKHEMTAKMLSKEFGHVEVDPYLTPWEKYLKDDHESRKLWISNRDFTVVPCTANPPTQIIPNFVNLGVWEGEPEQQWGKYVRQQKDMPMSTWVGRRGMRFNFSVKTPGPEVRQKQKEATRSSYPQIPMRTSGQ